jgi:hypothetical protein
MSSAPHGRFPSRPRLRIRHPSRPGAQIRVVVPVLAAGLVVLAGCSGGSTPVRSPATTRSASAAPTGTTGTPSATPSGSPAATRSAGLAAGTGRAPLTGLPGGSARPAVVVKIENSAAARPQAGLGAADIVVEELVEGGSTRFAAFYQSADPGTVGPVRSVRNVDAAIAGPTRGVLAFSGGAKVALRVVAGADLRLVAPGDVRGAFARSSARAAPHNLFLDVSTLWRPAAGTTSGRAAPGPYLPFGTTDPLVASTPAARATVRFSALERPGWTYERRGRHWLRSETGGRPAAGADGRRLVADAVLVLRVQVRDAGYRDPAGNPVPESVFVGAGDATLLTGGRAVRGRWSKAAAGSPLRLTTTAGTPLLVPPGRTWIELLPARGALTLG